MFCILRTLIPAEAGFIILFSDDFRVSGEALVAGLDINTTASGRLRLVFSSESWHLRAGSFGSGGFLVLVFLALRRTVRQSDSREEEEEREGFLRSLSGEEVCVGVGLRRRRDLGHRVT